LLPASARAPVGPTVLGAAWRTDEGQGAPEAGRQAGTI
jgi:hypothetical protein